MIAEPVSSATADVSLATFDADKRYVITECLPWKSIGDLEVAVAEYIDWFNFRRLHGEIDLVPPVEFETQHRSTTLAEQPAQRELEVSIKQ